MTRKELAKEYSNLVYFVYYNKINGYIRRKHKDYWEDAIHEGMIGLMKAIDKWADLGKPYDKQFRSVAIKYIFWEMIDFYKFGTTHFKLTDLDFNEKNIAATNRLREKSFSLDQSITDEGDDTDMYNFFGETVDTYDGIFYAELEKFLQFIPENEREIMRCYYYSNIEMYEDPNMAIALTAKRFVISTSRIKKIAQKWNNELYAYLHAERERLPDIHQRFENDRKKNEPYHYKERKQERRVTIVKDGMFKRVSEQIVDRYIADGWIETLSANDGAKIPKKYYVNNGKVTLKAFEDDIQKFLDIGFVRGKGKCPSNSGKIIRVDNGCRTMRSYENCLEYWKAIGYQVSAEKEDQAAKKKIKVAYIQLWKDDKVIRVPEDEAEEYFSAGWNKGSSKVKVCSIDGEIKTICKCNLEKYLSDDWVLFGIGKLALDQQKKDKQNSDKILIHNGMIEAYIDKDKLELFKQHGWQIGTVWVKVYKPGVSRENGKRSIPVGRLSEFLANGYTQ